MPETQFLLSKFYEIGSIVSAAVARVDRNQEDLLENREKIEDLQSQVTTLVSEVASLNKSREETREVAKQLLQTKPGRTANVIAISALCFSVLTFVTIIALQFYIYLHPIAAGVTGAH